MEWLKLEIEELEARIAPGLADHCDDKGDHDKDDHGSKDHHGSNGGKADGEDWTRPDATDVLRRLA